MCIRSSIYLCSYPNILQLLKDTGSQILSLPLSCAVSTLGTDVETIWMLIVASVSPLYNDRGLNFASFQRLLSQECDVSPYYIVKKY